MDEKMKFAFDEWQELFRMKKSYRPSAIDGVEWTLNYLRRDAERVLRLTELMREVGFISDKYRHWREIYPLAVDDPEYDCFAQGFKVALASVEAAIAAETERAG